MSDRIKAAPLSRLPPLPDPAALAEQQAREQRDAEIRGVSSIRAMRDAIVETSRAAPDVTEIPRYSKLDAAGFRALAARGAPFLIGGIVGRWPLSKLTPAVLRERFGDVPVRARVGDYITHAFATDRPMQDMAMRDYLDMTDSWTAPLPPYIGNLGLRELNSLCHWPAYFDKMGPPRFWIGPARTMTPLHCDYDDNIFAQIWGTKRIWLAPPHHGELLYTKEASAMLVGSPFDPDAPDYKRYPLARQATLLECVVQPGDMLYVPAGWYHQVRALTFSLSSNRWARAVPLALHPSAIKPA